jgi:hypothetical protein
LRHGLPLRTLQHMKHSSVARGDSSRKSLAIPVGEILLWIGGAALAFLLYRPHTAAPFEIIDFSETLPVLTSGDEFGERFHGLIKYYLGHGRAAIGLSAGLAAKWSLFGWWTPGWQWSRFAIFLLLAAAVWRLCRQLGANYVGASLAAALFIASETAAPGWLRPSVSEPFGALILVGAALLACRFQETARPTLYAVTIAALLAAMIAVKETLIAACFFPVALALCRGKDGILRWPERSTRNSRLVFVSSLAVAIALIPVVWAVALSAPDGYARQFGASDSLLSNAVFGAIPVLFPFTPVSNPPALLATVVDIAWLALLLAAWRRTENPVQRRHQLILFAFAFALPVARIAVYSPWPLQYPYYSIPFFLGVAILAAIGATNLSEQGAWGRTVALAAGVGVLAYAAVNVMSITSRQFALRRLSDRLVTELYHTASAISPDSILVGVPRAKEQAWWGLGPTLARFAKATNRPLPPVREVSCSEAQSLMTNVPAKLVVTAMRYQCDLSRIPASGPVETARRFNALSLRFVTDSLQAQVEPLSK